MNFVSNIENAYKWLEERTTQNYVPMPRSNDPYYEVTGYFVPTLLKLGFKQKARAFCDYLVEHQLPNGSWANYAFDTAQVIDGLSEFKDYNKAISKGVQFIKSVYKNGRFHDRNLRSPRIPEYIGFRILSVLKKANEDVTFFKEFIEKYKVCNFSYVSHFYAYAFEGKIALGLDIQPFLDTVKKYNGLVPVIPDKPNEYCYTGLSQIALCLFMLNEFDLGMNALTFVSQFQNKSGGFFGGSKNCDYFPTTELSWAVKYYLDAFYESQKFELNTSKNITNSNS